MNNWLKINVKKKSLQENNRELVECEESINLVPFFNLLDKIIKDKGENKNGEEERK